MKFSKNNLLLYAITDSVHHDIDTLIQQIESAAAGGATMIQLRKKNLSFEEFLSHALNVKKITEKYHIPLIINDNVDVAKLSDADGVHLGQGDMPASKARQILGENKIVGVTAKTVNQAKKAQSDGADYIGSGAMFATDTKLDATPLSYNDLKSICDSVSIPVVAIGGINSENILSLSGSHISGVAVVSAIFHKKIYLKQQKNCFSLQNKHVFKVRYLIWTAQS